MFSKKAIAYLVLLCCLLVVIAYPRFNRQDMGALKSHTSTEHSNADVAGKMSDAGKYASMVSYFRGEADLSELLVPWTYRPVVPYLASWLPFEPQTSVNILNEACLMAALFLAYAFMVILGVGFGARLLACALFVVSFPTFYYGAIGYIDPVLVLFIAVALHLIVRQQWIAFAVLTILASGIKESAGLVLLPAAAFLYARGELFRKKFILLGILTIVGYVIAYKLFQNWLLGSQDYTGWNISWEYVLRNFGRVRSWASILLVFGPVGILALFAWKAAPDSTRRKRAEMAALYGGLLAGILLSVYAMIGSLADGRSTWTMYPFAIPLAGITIQAWLTRRARA